MKRIFITIYFATVTLASVTSVTAAEAAEQKPYATGEIVPLIVIDDVRITDAIKNVARQMDLNFILDPRAPGSTYGPGRLVSEPMVKVRWEDITLQAALSNLLHAQKLTLVTNPMTTVARIAPIYRSVKPVPASQVGNNTNAIIPVVAMDNVSLVEAIKSLAEAAGLKVSIDPKVYSAAVFDREGTVSFRWEKITARQGLAALLDNYDLFLIEEPATSSARVTLKTKSGATPSR